MERLKFEECEKCEDWKGCITYCLNICGKPLDALEEFNTYKALEEQGRLLKLPCAIGDTIYYITGISNSLGSGRFCRVEESKAVGFHTDKDGLTVQLDYNWKGNHGTYGYFGKTIFLTKEEAEVALKAMSK